VTPSNISSRLCLVAAILFCWIQPAAAQDNSGMSAQTFALVIAGLLLICAAFGGYLIYAGLKSRKLAKASETWPTASGTVLSSEVKTHTVHTKQARTTTYTPKVTYSYAADGSSYVGSTIRFGDCRAEARPRRRRSPRNIRKAPPLSCATTRPSQAGPRSKPPCQGTVR
jgi:hypothetical protein